VRLLEFTTTATFYDGMPGLYFHTDFTNTAEDHRLCVHLKTGIQTNTVLADTAFGVIERPVRAAGSPFPNSPKMEGVSSTYPMVNACAVQDNNGAMALVARGLPEFEALHEDDQTTLALTLVRAVGWISRDDLRTRTASIGKVRAQLGAQSLRPISADYALMPVQPQNPSALLRVGNSYNAPLQAYQYDQRPDKLTRSYLSIQSNLGTGGESDGNGAILTALKPPQSGKGWIVRLFNPTSGTVEVNVTPNRKPKYGRLTTLAEEPIEVIEPDANGRLHLQIGAQKIVTLRLGFS
jgi:mannosylglycerate hydrolase